MAEIIINDVINGIDIYDKLESLFFDAEIVVTGGIIKDMHGVEVTGAEAASDIGRRLTRVQTALGGPGDIRVEMNRTTQDMLYKIIAIWVDAFNTWSDGGQSLAADTVKLIWQTIQLRRIALLSASIQWTASRLVATEVTA